MILPLNNVRLLQEAEKVAYVLLTEVVKDVLNGCNKDLILCKGDIRIHHFRHKIDCVNPCHHYSSPTESQIHKDGKMVLKHLLETKFKFLV